MVHDGEAGANEVVTLASELIQIDTTNTGNQETLAGERLAAEYVAQKLDDVGFETTYVEPQRRRGNVVARLPGADRGKGALLVHGHLDVVPANAAEWSVHPLSGAVERGYVWGRGAVDMKGPVAMMLTVARRLRRESFTPSRDLVFMFVADEETGGAFGSRWLVENRPELFDGVTEAIGEVGGFSVALNDNVRGYLVETAEKAVRMLTLRVRGTPGHGSMVNPDNAISKLVAALGRLDRHQFPIVLTDSVTELLAGVADVTGTDFSADDVESAIGRLGPLSRMLGATLRDTVNPTMLSAGYQTNVVPSVAEATVDCRVLPGREEDFERELAEVLGPTVEQDWIGGPSVRTTFDGALVEAMKSAIYAEDPGSRVLPYMLSGGTDAKSYQQLGIRCFGFTPMRLPADLDFSALFHGVDERVPIDGLRFGVRVLDRFLRNC